MKKIGYALLYCLKAMIKKALTNSGPSTFSNWFTSSRHPSCKMPGGVSKRFGAPVSGSSIVLQCFICMKFKIKVSLEQTGCLSRHLWPRKSSRTRLSCYVSSETVHQPGQEKLPTLFQDWYFYRNRKCKHIKRLKENKSKLFWISTNVVIWFLP